LFLIVLPPDCNIITISVQSYNFFLIYARFFDVFCKKYAIIVQKIWKYGKNVVPLRSIMAKIGVFDSGYGGLTILKEIRKVLPEYDYMYLGDNARAPYGTHSFDVIYRYTLQAVNFLFEQDCALVILACNTASAKALRTIQQRDLPEINRQLAIQSSINRPIVNRPIVNVLGVIRPTVEAVPEITKNGHVGILATPATVSSESYVMELEKLSLQPSAFGHQLVITQQACPMWVPLIEAGEHMNEGADYFVDKYLKELMAKDPQIDTLILGCTHYPLLKAKLSRQLSAISPQPIHIISQGALVAESLKDYLARHAEYREQLSQGGSCAYLTTENADRFSQSASIFLDAPVCAEHVEL